MHFFDPFWDGSFGDERRRALPARTSRARSGTIAGEWTPRYMYDVWTPALLARRAPADARLLVSLRDPLERYRSHLRTRIAALPDERVSSAATAAIALSRSLYAYPLLRVLRHFPREQVLVLQHERCRRRPAGELRRTFEFLGLDDVDWMPPDAEQPGERRATGVESRGPRAGPGRRRSPRTCAACARSRRDRPGPDR